MIKEWKKNGRSHLPKTDAQWQFVVSHRASVISLSDTDHWMRIMCMILEGSGTEIPQYIIGIGIGMCGVISRTDFLKMGGSRGSINNNKLLFFCHPTLETHLCRQKRASTWRETCTQMALCTVCFTYPVFSFILICLLWKVCCLFSHYCASYSSFPTKRL